MPGPPAPPEGCRGLSGQQRRGSVGRTVLGSPQRWPAGGHRPGGSPPADTLHWLVRSARPAGRACKPEPAIATLSAEAEAAALRDDGGEADPEPGAALRERTQHLGLAPASGEGADFAPRRRLIPAPGHAAGNAAGPELPPPATRAQSPRPGPSRLRAKGPFHSGRGRELQAGEVRPGRLGDRPG